MLKKGMGRGEIEEFLKNKGDFVQVDHLTRFLDIKDIPTDVRRFCYLKLVSIYERRYMFSEVAKTYGRLAEVALTFNDKIDCYVKETEAYAKAGLFEKADEALKMAINFGNASQKAEVLFEIKDFYKKQAEIYEKEKRRNQAVKIYEKLASMNLSENEKFEIKEKLLGLYENLGKIREYQMLKGKF